MSILRNISTVTDKSWPEWVDIYAPDIMSEISLPDYANTLSCQTFLRMCKVQNMVWPRTNAEFMAPNGKVPVIKIENSILSDFDDLVEFLNLKGKGLKMEIDEESMSEMHAHMAMVQTVLGNAEMYIAWFDKAVSNDVTKLRYGSPYPWPLNRILPLIKQKQVHSVIKAHGWAELTENQVCEKVRQCCEALSAKLGKKRYFFGEAVTPLDALVFGNLFAIVTTILPNNCLLSVVKDFDNLQEFLRNINETFYKGEAGTSPVITASRLSE